MVTLMPTMAEVAKAIGADVDLVTAEQALIEARGELYKCASHEVHFDTADGTFSRTTRSLRLGKRIPEDWAALLWTENARVEVAGDNEQAYVDTVLGPKHAALIGEAIERAMGLGTVGLDLLWDYQLNWLGRVKPTAMIPRLDVTDASGVIPLSWDKNGVSEVALVSYGKDEVFVREHREGWVINRRFAVNGGSLTPAELPDGVAESVAIEDQVFALIEPAIASGLAIGYPYGVSVLDSAQDHISAADMCFDNFGEDFALGGKKVFISESLLKKNEAGTGYLSPDRSRRQMYLAMRDAAGEGEFSKGITEYNPNLRVEDNTSAINTALGLVSASVGFGYGYYSFEGNGIRSGSKTATEVVAQNSDLYRMRQKHFLALSGSLERIARAVLQIGNQYGGQRLNANAEIRVISDDSVIEDDRSHRADGIVLFRAGLISQQKFLVDYMHMTEGDAAKEVAASIPTIPGLV